MIEAIWGWILWGWTLPLRYFVLGAVGVYAVAAGVTQVRKRPPRIWAGFLLFLFAILVFLKLGLG
jgi:hypothetical protein